MRNINEIKESLDKAYDMNTVPGGDFPRYKKNHIEDENKSVKWNRQFILDKDAAYKAEEKRLINEKNKEIKRCKNEVFDYIVDKIHCCKRSAEIIYEKAYLNGHSDGIEDIFALLDEYMYFIGDVIKAEMESKQSGGNE